MLLELILQVMAEELKACNIVENYLKGTGQEGRACDIVGTDVKGITKNIYSDPVI